MPVVKVLTSQLGAQVVSVLQTDGQPAELIPVDVNTTGGLVPLVQVTYVDNSGIAPPSPDGSIGAPFHSLADAIAFGKVSGQARVFLLAAQDYSSEPAQTTVGIPSVAFVSLSGGIGTTQLPSIDFTGSTELILVGVTVLGDVTGATALQGWGSTIIGRILGTAAVLWEGGEIIGAGITATTFEGFGVEIGSGSYNFSLAGTRLRLVGCPAIDPTAANSIVFTGAAGTVFADALAAWTIAQGAATLTNGSLQTQSRGAQIQKSVTVPALLAGVLGYVDVDVSGTALAPLATTDVVTVSPTADLAAAGADGGFLASWYVSAANTVRLAFVGALAGGAVDFRFARA